MCLGGYWQKDPSVLWSLVTLIFADGPPSPPGEEELLLALEPDSDNDTSDTESFDSRGPEERARDEDPVPAARRPQVNGAGLAAHLDGLNGQYQEHVRLRQEHAALLLQLLHQAADLRRMKRNAEVALKSLRERIVEAAAAEAEFGALKVVRRGLLQGVPGVLYMNGARSAAWAVRHDEFQQVMRGIMQK